MILQVDVVKAAVKIATQRYMTVKFPEMVRSNDVFVPHINFLRNEWWQWWTSYVHRRGIRNFNRTFCDTVTQMAVAEMNYCAGLKAEMDRRDATAGLFEARVHIDKHPFLSINEMCSHFNCLLVFTKDERSWELAIWEPQNPVFEYTPLDKALERLTVYDIAF